MGTPESGTPLIQMMVYCQIQKNPHQLDISIVHYFIENGAVLSRVLDKGICENCTALALSIHLKRFDVTKSLVQKGVDPVLGGEPNRRPVLQEYIQFGSNHFLSWLLNKHLPPAKIPEFIDKLFENQLFDNAETNHFASLFGRNAVHAFLLCGKREAVECLLERQPDLLHQQDTFKKAALHIAAEKGDLETINILLAKYVIIAKPDFLTNFILIVYLLVSQICSCVTKLV